MADILITSEYFGKFSGKARETLLLAGHTVTDNPYGHKFLSPEEIIPHIGRAEALICDLERISAEVIDAAPRLKAVARRGVGLDSVDLAKCAQRGIAVMRTPGLVEAPVAELVLAYILQLSRRIAENDRRMHEGAWEKILGHSVAGKTLGILGLGNIGREVAVRAKSFGMELIYCDRSAATSAEGAERVGFDELLKRSDFLTLHIPLTSETRNIIDYAQLKQMKPTACVINTARGGIINEAALARALGEKVIAGAAVDVFDVEPNTESPLRNLPGVILTPHIATFTVETFIAMDELCAKNLIEYFKMEREKDNEQKRVYI